MRLTFLGHQGWQFENNKGRSFLLDPIAEAIGNGDVQLPVWPARRLDFDKMAPIDAVIISHEHADHFSLHTLNLLPRRCRVLVSDLASYAMVQAIHALGFQVDRFTALKTFSLNGLKITPLPALYNVLEPDVYALLVEDDSRASFLTAIDTVAHPDLFTWLDNNCPHRTLDNLTNNFTESRHALVEDESAHLKSHAVVTATTLEFVQKFKPQRAVVAGQGWSFQGAKAEFNHTYFSVDNHWLVETARQFASHVEWIEGKPGMRFTLTGADLSIDESPAVLAEPSPDRTFIPSRIDRSEPYAPWTGIRELPPERLAAVKRFIAEEYGGILGAHAPKLMEGLYYLKSFDSRNLLTTMGIVLRNGNARTLLAFDYGQVLFQEVRADPARPPAIGFEIWAADFEHLIAAREEVFMVYESAVRPWTFVPAAIPQAQLIESFMGFTPRFRPRETLAFYKERLGLSA